MRMRLTESRHVTGGIAALLIPCTMHQAPGYCVQALYVCAIFPGDLFEAPEGTG